MNYQAKAQGAAGGADVIPARNYISRDFAEREAEDLWPRVWQMACREEEIAKVGDFYTYDILDQSIIVLRAEANLIKAYYNVCPHRGRALTEGCGHTARLFCKYHGWQWMLTGENSRVIDRDDWGGALTDDQLALREVKSDRWGGWIYINMDPASISLEEHLAPAKAFLDPFDFAGMRYKWRKSTIVPCNWKVALEAFNDGYHVQATHPQMLHYFDDYTNSYAHGRHAHFGYWDGSLPIGSKSKRLTNGAPTEDIRPGLLDYMEDMAATLNQGAAQQAAEAARRVIQEVPPGTPAQDVLMKFGQFIYESTVAAGVQFPPISGEQIDAAGIDWHLFPNQIMLQGPTGLLGYRARPNGMDPDSCVWDAYTLERYAPGAEPRPPHEWSDDLTDAAFWGKILTQDYQNMGQVQKGLKSKGFAGALPNPKQEVAILNFHRALIAFLDEGYGR